MIHYFCFSTGDIHLLWLWEMGPEKKGRIYIWVQVPWRPGPPVTDGQRGWRTTVDIPDWINTCTLSFVHQVGDSDAHLGLFYISLVHNASGAPPILYNYPRPPAPPFVTPPSHSIRLNPSKSPLSENFMEHFCAKKEVECGRINIHPVSNITNTNQCGFII